MGMGPATLGGMSMNSRMGDMYNKPMQTGPSQNFMQSRFGMGAMRRNIQRGQQNRQKMADNEYTNARNAQDVYQNRNPAGQGEGYSRWLNSERQGYPTQQPVQEGPGLRAGNDQPVNRPMVSAPSWLGNTSGIMMPYFGARGFSWVPQEKQEQGQLTSTPGFWQNFVRNMYNNAPGAGSDDQSVPGRGLIY
jgi:hypothetical protein